MFQNIHENWRSRNNRVRSVVILNLLIATYYLYLFIAPFYRANELPTLNLIRYGMSFLGMVIGGFFLFRGSRLGKIATQFVGVLGIVSAIGYACYGLTFLGRPGYSDVIIINYTVDYVWNVFVKHIYPLIAGFVILGLPNERLGLK